MNCLKSAVNHAFGCAHHITDVEGIKKDLINLPKQGLVMVAHTIISLGTLFQIYRSDAVKPFDVVVVSCSSAISMLAVNYLERNNYK